MNSSYTCYCILYAMAMEPRRWSHPSDHKTVPAPPESDCLGAIVCPTRASCLGAISEPRQSLQLGGDWIALPESVTWGQKNRVDVHTPQIIKRFEPRQSLIAWGRGRCEQTGWPPLLASHDHLKHAGWKGLWQGKQLHVLGHNPFLSRNSNSHIEGYRLYKKW